MSKVIANTYRHSGASTDAITLDSSGNATFPGNVTITGTVTGDNNTVYDDTNIRKDLNTLALQTAVDTNRKAYNLTNSFIDQFEDDTGIGSETTGDRNASEYWATAIPVADAGGSLVDLTSSNTDFSSGTSNDNYGDGNDIGIDGSYNYSYFQSSKDLTGDFIIQFTGVSNDVADSVDSNHNSDYYEFGVTTSTDQVNHNLNHHDDNSSATAPFLYISFGGNNKTINIRKGTGQDNSIVQARYESTWSSSDTWRFARKSSTLYLQKNGETVYTFSSSLFNTTADLRGMWGFGVAAGNRNFYNCKYNAGITTIKGVDPDTTNATGTLVGTANTASSSRTKVSGTFLYKNASGTATVGTDIKIYFTCNGGTNWTEAASYTAGSDFSTGIKTIYLGETTCTAGTDVRYKAVFANQAAGSKVTELHGIGVNY